MSSAGAIFGPSQVFATPVQASPFAVTQTGSAERQQLEAIATSQIREREQLQGFKTDLLPAQRERLARLQAEIAEVEQEADGAGLSERQITERADLFLEAYAILGKDFVDIENTPELSAIDDQVKELLEPQLVGARKRQLESLESIKETLTEQIAGGNDSPGIRSLFTNVTRQINALIPSRTMDQLSIGEVREYDALVERANTIAGSEVLLPSRKQRRVEELQTSISSLQSQIGSLPAPQRTPTPGQAAAAYRGG
ncbi:MAG: hypothetical protein AAF638_04120 [Pseudomonadota bacterium]